MKLKRIVVIRHAESEEDINPNLSGERADKQISITRNGHKQAHGVIDRIIDRVSVYDSIRIYSSPSNRVIQTALIVKSGLEPMKTDLLVEPRIRNLDWGNTTPENIKEIERQRYEAGVLHYQFPGGDHSPTFVENIGIFIDELLNPDTVSTEAVVIVTHGFALRVMAKFLLKMDEEDFRWIKNPPNCYIADFTIHEDGKITIDKPLAKRNPT